MSLVLFCTLLVILLHKHPPCLPLHSSSLCMGVFVLSPPTPGQEKAFYLSALMDRFNPQPCTVPNKEFIFSVLTPSHLNPVSINVFSMGLADQVCISLCECVYITVHVWKNKMGSFLYVLVLFQCMLFYVWMVLCHGALLRNKSSSVLSSTRFTFLTSSQ